MINKYENFLSKLLETPQFTREIEDLFEDEYCELFEDILIKEESDFMTILSLHVKSILQENYSTKIFENRQFINIFKSAEKNIHDNLYLRDKNKLLNKKNYNSRKAIYFRKHCRYQDDTPLHTCDQNVSHFVTILDNGAIFAIKCTKCERVYKPNYIQLYCSFCYLNYYSCLENSKVAQGIQPSTWEKYHCNLIINEQMKCIKCKNPLSYDIKNNLLTCLTCGFTADPWSILWTCLKCGSEFHSNAKIYNPYEFKPLSLAIKKAMFEKIIATPKILPCGHSGKGIVHNKVCQGELYVAYLNDRKMVMCSVCNALTKYNRYVWVCTVCGNRFRDEEEGNDEHRSVGYGCKRPNISEKATTTSNNSSTVSSTINAEQSPYMKRDTNENFKDSFLSNNEFFKRKSNSNITQSKSPMKKMSQEDSSINSKVSIPLFDLNDYDAISQIHAGKTAKFYCVKANSANDFFAMKKLLYSNEDDLNKILFSSAVQYSVSQNNYIVSLKGINIVNDEINILFELGMNSWNSEIISMKKIKKLYKEDELVKIIYQLSKGLEEVQNNNYAHFNINPTNVIVFKDNIYKITNFTSIKALDSKETPLITTNKFISPNLKSLIESNKMSDKIDLVKCDVYSLGLCIIYCMMTQNELTPLLSDFVQIDINNINNREEYIEKLIRDYMKGHTFSETFVEMMKRILCLEEDNRFDFTALTDFIEYKYNLG